MPSNIRQSIFCKKLFVILPMKTFTSWFDSYKHVHNQGDGIKSFTGILLYLMLDYYCTFLIDEPESFLHPPQANIMGRIIVETLSNDQQAFISTHSEDIIKGLLSICPNIVGNLHSSKENVSRSEVSAIVEQVLSSSKKETLSKKEIELIKNSLKTVSKWAPLKEYGIKAIPRGDAATAFNSMNDTLKEHGIFIVPVGELECFIKEVGGHGPDWVNTVLEKYPDLDNPVYEDITQFVQSLNPSPPKTDK